MVQGILLGPTGLRSFYSGIADIRFHVRIYDEIVVNDPSSAVNWEGTLNPQVFSSSGIKTARNLYPYCDRPGRRSENREAKSKVISQRTKVEPVVYVVDDDPQTCKAVAELVHTFGYQVKSFGSPVDFLESVDETRPGCVVLDIRLPGLDGMEVHQQLVQRGIALPLVVLTKHADTSMTVRSLRSGAVTVLDKPFRDDELWSYIQEALQRSENECRRQRHLTSLELRLKHLAPQDRSVLKLMLNGMKNRTIAKQLDVSLRTVENRRRRVFEVMHADSVAQLTRMVVEYEHNLMPVANLQESWLSLPFEKMAS